MDGRELWPAPVTRVSIDPAREALFIMIMMIDGIDVWGGPWLGLLHRYCCINRFVRACVLSYAKCMNGNRYVCYCCIWRRRLVELWQHTHRVWLMGNYECLCFNNIMPNIADLANEFENVIPLIKFKSFLHTWNILDKLLFLACV